MVTIRISDPLGLMATHTMAVFAATSMGAVEVASATSFPQDPDPTLATSLASSAIPVVEQVLPTMRAQAMAPLPSPMPPQNPHRTGLEKAIQGPIAAQGQDRETPFRCLLEIPTAVATMVNRAPQKSRKPGLRRVPTGPTRIQIGIQIGIRADLEVGLTPLPRETMFHPARREGEATPDRLHRVPHLLDSPLDAQGEAADSTPPSFRCVPSSSGCPLRASHWGPPSFPLRPKAFLM